MHLLKKCQKLPKGNKGSMIGDTQLDNIDMILLYVILFKPWHVLNPQNKITSHVPHCAYTEHVTWC